MLVLSTDPSRNAYRHDTEKVPIRVVSMMGPEAKDSSMLSRLQVMLY